MTTARLFPAFPAEFAKLTSLACLLWLACSTATILAADRPPRFAVMRADGSRVVGQALNTTPVDPKQPLPPDWKLDEQPLWDAPQPPLWLRDRSVPLASLPPSAFVEMISGDRLPGSVVGFEDGRMRPFDPAPSHLIVRPDAQLSPPQPVADPIVRVAIRYVRKVVWQRRDVESWQPGTVFYRDGRAVPFRAVRWNEQSVQLLFADGPKSVSFSELAEVHLPVADFWDAHWEELATLCPRGEGRLWQFETNDGLIVTTSRERLRMQHPGGPQDFNRWIHGLHPAWSLDALWIKQHTVGIVRSFAPHETPLARVQPAAQRQQGWITEQGTPLRVNRNVQRGSLRGGDGEYGWGFGVQAISRLEFDVPPAARSLRSRVGLDRMAGKGGCIRARVFVGGATAPAYESGYLVGSDTVADTAVVALPAGQTKPLRLALEIDAAHEGRPAGADPFDIRDLANWLDPLLTFDPAWVKQELTGRAERPGAPLAGWAVKSPSTPVPAPQPATPQPSAPTTRSVANAWDELASSPGRFVLVETVAGGPIAWTREAKLEPHDRWLVVAASLVAAIDTPPRLEVWIDDELAGEQTLIVRNGGQRDPPPLLVSLQPYAGRTVKCEIRLIPGKTPAVMTWRVARLNAQTPTIFQALDDEADWVAAEGNATRPKWDAEERVSGRRSALLAADAIEETLFPAAVSVREAPAWGEYRYATMAMRKAGEGQVSVELLPTEPRERALRLDGGPGPPAFGEAVRFYQAKLPDQWLTIPVDLFANLGRFDARGLRLSGIGGGPVRFDAIYLVRTQGDFEQIPFVAGPFRPTTKATEDATKAIAARVTPSLVTFPAASGKLAYGVIVGGNGEVLTTGRALGEPNRAFSVTLADGKIAMAKAKGIHREGDLGLLQLEGPGPWQPVEVLVAPALQPNLVYAQVVRTPKADSPSVVEVKPSLVLRTTRATLWTDVDGATYDQSSTPLVDAYGRLVGLGSRRHATGLLNVRVVDWPAVAARLRAGEAWGEWPTTLGAGAGKGS